MAKLNWNRARTEQLMRMRGAEYEPSVASEDRGAWVQMCGGSIVENLRLPRDWTIVGSVRQRPAK